MSHNPSMFNTPFMVISSIAALILLLVFGLIVAALVRAARQKRANDASPMVTGPATVVNMRQQVHGGGETNAVTRYFVTFELASGERLEFLVKPQESGLLAVGDRGTLTHQGTRYQGFTRGGQLPSQ